MSNQELVQLTPQQEVASQVRSEEFMRQVAVALPEGMRPERFVRVVVTALNDNADLVTADRGSFFQAALHAAKDGLLPDGREAAFVIFKDRVAYMPMIGGFRKIAAEFGWTIRTAVVYANDEFAVELGDTPKVRHVPVRPGAARGEKIAAYAVATHRDGRLEVEVMDAAEIAKVRAVARTQTIWNAWEDQMWEKSPGRRIFKKLPLADRDRQERVLAAGEDPGDAAAALYGPQAREAFPPNVDRETGEITSGADSPTTDAGEAAAPGDQQVAEAGSDAPQASDDPPLASATPDDEEPEPTLGDEPADAPATQESLLDTPAHFVVPSVEGIGEAWRGKTFAEIAAIERTDEDGVKLGEKWLDYVARHPAKYPPELHAALQRFRPGLFPES